MGKTVGELEQMSARELDEWIAYDSLDPIGNYRMDLQTAHLLYAQSDGKHKLQDFLPIDPNPMTEQMREQIEIEKEKARIQQEMMAMIEMFNENKSTSI